MSMQLFLGPLSADERRACDPDATPEELSKLAQRAPRAFLSNPALLMFSVLNPEFFRTLPDSSKLALLDQVELPVAILHELIQPDSEVPRVAVAAMAHPHATMRLLDSLVRKYWNRLGSPRRLRPKDRGKIKHLTAAFQGKNADPKAPLETRLRQYLASAPDAMAAPHVETPVERLQQLAAEGNVKVKRAVALNPSSPLGLLESLVSAGDLGVLLPMAQALELRPEIAAALARSEHVSARALLAHNLATPPGVLERLAADPSPLVRTAARSRLDGAAPGSRAQRPSPSGALSLPRSPTSTASPCALTRSSP